MIVMDAPLQVVVGDSPSVAALVFLGRTAAFLIACWIAWRTYRGYERVRAPALLWLALGIALLAAVPTMVRFLLPTATNAPALTTTALARTSEVAGLLAILYAVYGRP